VSLTLLVGYLILGRGDAPSWVDRRVATLQYETAGKEAQNPAAAIKNIDEAIKRKPNNALSYYQKAVMVAKAGNWKRADQLIAKGNGCKYCIDYQWSEFRILSQYLGLSQAKDFAVQFQKDRKSIPVDLRVQLASDVRAMSTRLMATEPPSEYCLLFGSTVRSYADHVLVEALGNGPGLAAAQQNLAADDAWRVELRKLWVQHQTELDYHSFMDKYGFGDLAADVETAQLSPEVIKKLKAASDDYVGKLDATFQDIRTRIPG